MCVPQQSEFIFFLKITSRDEEILLKIGNVLNFILIFKNTHRHVIASKVEFFVNFYMHKN
jgi:hypothetical protein